MTKQEIYDTVNRFSTENMAGVILEGAKEVNPETAIFNVSEISAADAADYDTLILGCSAMGAEVLEESEFEPFFTELEAKISGKNVAIWGDGEWMRDWEKRVTDAVANLIGGEGLMINDMLDDDGLGRYREFGKIAANI